MTLRVRLEIVPFGNEDKVREIGRLDIFNLGVIELGRYEYGVIQIDLENNEAGMLKTKVYHRKDLGAWELVRKTLEELKGQEEEATRSTNENLQTT